MVEIFKKINWLTILVLCIFAQMVSAETVVVQLQDALERKPVLGERTTRIDEGLTPSDIDKMLNIHGSTAAGNVSNNTMNYLPYEEMGVYGVEYENIFIDRYLYEPGSFRSNMDKNPASSDTGGTSSQ